MVFADRPYYIDNTTITDNDTYKQRKWSFPTWRVSE